MSEFKVGDRAWVDDEVYTVEKVHSNGRVDVKCESNGFLYDNQGSALFTPDPDPPKFRVGDRVEFRMDGNRAYDGTILSRGGAYDWAVQTSASRSPICLDNHELAHAPIPEHNDADITNGPEPGPAERFIKFCNDSKISHGPTDNPFRGPVEPQYEHFLACKIIWPDGRRYESPGPVGDGWEEIALFFMMERVGDMVRFKFSNESDRDRIVNRDALAAVDEGGYKSIKHHFYRRPIQPPERYQPNDACLFLGQYQNIGGE